MPKNKPTTTNNPTVNNGPTSAIKPLPPYLNRIATGIEKHGMHGWLLRELADSFEDARLNKRRTHNEHDFEVRWPEFLSKLTSAILERHYEPSSSISFIVFEPKIREIFGAPFIDRVVHHFLYRMQADWWDRRLIYDSYSCRVGKGTLFGVQRVQKMMQRATKGGTEEAMYIQLDLQGYFMSLDRKKLFECVDNMLMCQYAPYFKRRKAVYWLYLLCRFLWRVTLMDDPSAKARRRGPLSNWKLLPKFKSLFTQVRGLGIVIGNLTSQLVSNLFLDQLDRFVKYELGYKFYCRYVDDFIIIVPRAKYNQAKRDVKKIEEFLTSIGLTLHPKKRQYQSVYKGLTFLGVRITPFCLYPARRIQRHFEGAMRKLSRGQATNETINSYLGLFLHLDARKYIDRVFSQYGIDPALWDEWCTPKYLAKRTKAEIINQMRAQAQAFYASHKSKNRV